MSLRTLKEFRYACLHDGKHMLEHFFTLLNFRRFFVLCAMTLSTQLILIY